MNYLECFQTTKPSSGPRSPGLLPLLKVSIIHDDAGAMQRAMSTLERLELGLPNEIVRGEVSWRFELLENIAWRCRAVAEVVGSDILILAISNLEKVPVALNQWIDLCIERKRGQNAVVLGLFGPNDAWTLEWPSLAAVSPAPTGVVSIADLVRQRMAA